MKDRRDYHKKYYQERKAALKEIKRQREQILHPPQPKGVWDLGIQQIPDYIPKPVEVKASTVSTDVKNVYKWVIYGVLGVFLILNTSFLVNEQIRFYELKQYSFRYSLFMSLLCETAVILLSFFFAQSKIFLHKVILGFVLFMTVACILSIIYLGVDRAQAESEKNSEISTLMRNEIKSLSEQLDEKPKLALTITKKEKLLSDFLKTHDILSSGIETFSLVVLRTLSIAWNVIFSVLIAFVFQEKYAK